MLSAQPVGPKRELGPSSASDRTAALTKRSRANSDATAALTKRSRANSDATGALKKRGRADLHREAAATTKRRGVWELDAATAATTKRRGRGELALATAATTKRRGLWDLDAAIASTESRGVAAKSSEIAASRGVVARSSETAASRAGVGAARSRGLAAGAARVDSGAANDAAMISRYEAALGLVGDAQKRRRHEELLFRELGLQVEEEKSSDSDAQPLSSEGEAAVPIRRGNVPSSSSRTTTRAKTRTTSSSSIMRRRRPPPAGGREGGEGFLTMLDSIAAVGASSAEAMASSR